jgi:intracellular sulfur oxidation DsrE/DsrF family protein
MKLLTMVTLVLLLSNVFHKSTAAEFADGPVIFGYGKHTHVQQDIKLEKDSQLKVVFDVSKPGKDGAVNRGFDSVARFLNMHVANDIPAKNIHLAIVVHGGASNEMLNNKAYLVKYGKENPNVELISTLLKNNVQIIECGQSAAYHQIVNQDMIEGVDMALSAMTAHAILAAQGYSQNPF